MHLCMRTTLDLPDPLMQQAKHRMAEKGITFRALVIHALEQELSTSRKDFQLRDASVGDPSAKNLNSEEINQAIDQQRQPFPNR